MCRTFQLALFGNVFCNIFMVVPFRKNDSLCIQTTFLIYCSKFYVLHQLTSLLSDIGLNIQEAHAYSTTDGYSLDVFVVDGWPCEVLACHVHILL